MQGADEITLLRLTLTSSAFTSNIRNVSNIIIVYNKLFNEYVFWPKGSLSRHHWFPCYDRGNSMVTDPPLPLCLFSFTMLTVKCTFLNILNKRYISCNIGTLATAHLSLLLVVACVAESRGTTFAFSVSKLLTKWSKI